jgi:hypothetical protein
MRFGSEYRWILEGYTPETIPMFRLAEYMQQLAKLLGQEASVHFEKIEKGSVALVSRVDRYAVSKVNARVKAVRQRTAPNDVMRVVDGLNSMLADDQTSASLKEGNSVVIRFPGIRAQLHPAFQVPDQGSVLGYLYMLSEAGRGFNARIRLESGGVLMCTVAPEMAKNLREHLFETVKVFGTGFWTRSVDGIWTAASLDIKEVVPADSAKLRAIVDELRNLNIEWDDYRSLEDPNIGNLRGQLQ